MNNMRFDLQIHATRATEPFCLRKEWILEWESSSQVIYIYIYIAFCAASKSGFLVESHTKGPLIVVESDNSAISAHETWNLKPSAIHEKIRLKTSPLRIGTSTNPSKGKILSFRGVWHKMVYRPNVQPTFSANSRQWERAKIPRNSSTMRM